MQICGVQNRLSNVVKLCLYPWDITFIANYRPFTKTVEITVNRLCLGGYIA